MPFFLVCPFNNNTDDPGEYYWMRDGGERWIHFVRGIWVEKNEKDHVKKVIRVADVSELDWRETPLRIPASSSGWLSRGGKYFGCPPNWHDKFAAYVLGLKVDELETTGWVRVNNSRYYSCEQSLSAEQKNWLSIKGYRIYE